MQQVSQAFLNAVLATERQWKPKVTLALFNNDQLILTGGTVSSTGDFSDTYDPSTAFQALNVIDGKSSIGFPTAVADTTVFPGTNIFPVPDDGTAGWWGSALSDSSGNFSPTQYLTVNYGSSKILKAFSVACDTTLGYPVNFTIDTSPDGTTWTNQVTVTGNTSVVWTQQLSSTLTAQYVRLGMTKWSIPNRHPVVLEFSNGWILTTDGDLQDRVVSIQVTREAYYQDETSLPVGNYSMAECILELANDDGVFFTNNTSSPYYGYLMPNKQVQVSIGLYIGVGKGYAESDGYEYIPQGTFYTLGFNGGLGQPTVKIECWDLMKKLKESTYLGGAILENQTISQLQNYLLNDYGLDSTQYVIDPTTDVIDFAYFDTQGSSSSSTVTLTGSDYLTHLIDLTVAETGFIFTNAAGQVVCRDRHFFWSTRLASQSGPTLTVEYTGGAAAGMVVFVMDGTNYDVYVISSVDSTNNTITLGYTPTNTYFPNAYIAKSLWQSPMLTIHATDTTASISNAQIPLADGANVPSGIYLVDSLGFEQLFVSNVTDTTITFLHPSRTYTNGYIAVFPIAAVLTNNNALVDMSDTYSLDTMKNSIVVFVNPLTLAKDAAGNLVGSTQTWQDQDAFNLAASGTTWVDSTNPDPNNPGGNASDTWTDTIVFSAPPVLVDSSHASNVSVLVNFQTGTDGSGNPTFGTPVVDPTLGALTVTDTNPMDNSTNAIQKYWTDKSGTHLTPNYPYGWGGYLVLKNASGTNCRVLQITIDGYTLSRTSRKMKLQEAAVLKGLYGEKKYQLDSPFITNELQATNIAKNLLFVFQNPSLTQQITLTKRGLPHLELGDRVQVFSPVQGLTQPSIHDHFHIVKTDLKLDGSGLDETLTVITAP